MMSDTNNITIKPCADDTIKKALKDSPGATAEIVAGAAGISPSNARKMLAQLVEAGEVTRAEGGREEGRRRPDRYSLQGTAEKEPESVAIEPTVSSESDAQVKAADLDYAESSADVDGRESRPRKGSTMWAAIEVLRDHGKPMSAAEIY